MAIVLGINSVFHDPSAALVVDGNIVAAAEEERFTRRKHGKRPVPFSAWELPEKAIAWCLDSASMRVDDLDAVAYSYDPERLPPATGDPTHSGWEELRTLYVRRAPQFLRTVLGTDAPVPVAFVPHHEAHAASAYLPAGFEDCAVLVVDGRGETTSTLAGWVREGHLKALAASPLPNSLGLLYEELTEHLGFLRSSDEYKIMALASYGSPIHLDELRRRIRFDGEGGFLVDIPAWERLEGSRADLASSVQIRLEEVLVDAARWLRDETGERRLAMAGGVALNCVANSRIHREAGFDEVWVQPAAGDAGTSLGAACLVAQRLGDTVVPTRTAALGRSFSDDEIEGVLIEAGIPHQRPADLADTVAGILADDGIVGWFQGPAEFGPRALGHRSLLAHPGVADNTERLNVVKGREQFRPVAPMVLEEEAGGIFSGGPLPSPHMLFTHHVAEAWRDRIPAVIHVDGTARVQTVGHEDEPLMHRCLSRFHAKTGLPVLVNTSFNTAGRPMVDHPREALECFGSASIDALAIGSFLVTRAGMFGSR